MKKKSIKSAVAAILFFKMGPKIFPEKTFLANLKALAIILKVLEH